MRILFIGDVVARVGRRAVKEFVPRFLEEQEIGFCIANGENAAGGIGLTPKIAEELFEAGVDVITSGNHIWDRAEIVEAMEDERILRPANYPPGVPGRGAGIYEARGGVQVGVVNLSGRVFMPSLDCPFRVGMSLVKQLRQSTPIVIVDFHAEATSEKVAMGWYMDGLATAVLGTHTHVQTADERILPNGTAYISDVGMTGPYDSVIGVKKEKVLERFLYQTPIRFEPAKGDVWFCAVVVDVDEKSGRAKAIYRIQEKVFD